MGAQPVASRIARTGQGERSVFITQGYAALRGPSKGSPASSCEAAEGCVRFIKLRRCTGRSGRTRSHHPNSQGRASVCSTRTHSRPGRRVRPRTADLIGQRDSGSVPQVAPATDNNSIAVGPKPSGLTGTSRVSNVGQAAKAEFKAKSPSQ